MDKSVPVLREMMLPRDENVWGTAGGGKILEMIDLASGIEAMKHSKGNRVVTVAIKEVVFKMPVLTSDILSVYAEVIKIGRTSITIALEADYLRKDGSTGTAVTAQAVFVAVDEHGMPAVIGEE